MLHTLSHQAHFILNTYALVGVGLTGVTLVGSWIQKNYDGPLKQVWSLVTHLKADKQRLQAQLHQLRHDQHHQSANLNYWQLQAESLQSQLQILSTSYERIQEDYDTLQAQFESLQVEQQRTQYYCRDLESQVQTAQYENEQLRQANQEQTQELTEASTALTQLQSSYRDLEAEQQSLYTQWQSTTAEHVVLRENLNAVFQREKEAAETIVLLERQITQLHQENSQLIADNEWREERLKTLRFWEWLGGGSNNFIPASQSMLGVYAWEPLQHWWQNTVGSNSSSVSREI